MKGGTSILILTLLEKENMYGYQITQELKKRSGNAFELKEGALYPTLRALEKEEAERTAFSHMGAAAESGDIFSKRRRLPFNRRFGLAVWSALVELCFRRIKDRFEDTDFFPAINTGY